MTEIAAPFIDESIWTEAAADIDLYPLLPGRGGRTREGRICTQIKHLLVIKHT